MEPGIGGEGLGEEEVEDRAVEGPPRPRLLFEESNRPFDLSTRHAELDGTDESARPVLLVPGGSGLIQKNLHFGGGFLQ